MKHALILSGGGYKCAFQVGAYQILKERGIKFSAVSGISGGGLNTALIAQEKDKELMELWNNAADGIGGIIFGSNLAEISDGKMKANISKIKEVALKGISKGRIFSALTSTFFNGRKFEETAKQAFDNIDYSDGLLTNTPLIELLQKYIKLKDFKMDAYLGITEFTTGLGWELSVKEDFITDKDVALAYAASANMPVILPNIPRINTKKGTFIELVDGGLRTVSPIGQVFDSVERANKNEDWTFWVVNANSKMLPVMEDMRRMSVRIGRSIDVLLNQVFNDDIDKTVIINKAAKSLGKKEVIINIIEPQPGLLGSTLDCRKEVIDQRISMGRALTSAYFSD